MKIQILALSFLICTSLQAQESWTTYRSENYKIKELDFDTAVLRTLHQSITLNIANDEAEARRFLVKQAKLYPNPEVSYEVEEFAGNRNWKGWDNREERYFWSQLVETAGKIRLRTEAATYQYYAALVGYDISKLIVLNNLSKAFIAVMGAQEFLKVAFEQTEIAKEILWIATKKVEAGKVSLIQQNKAEIAYSEAVIAIEKAQVEFENAKRRLALIWAHSCPDFEKVVFPFFDITQPIPLEQCLTDLCNQPEIVQVLYNYLNMHKTWHLEKANRIPNVTLQVGYKANYRENNQGMMAAISVPIPIFNRNQGNIGRAYFDMLKTGEQGKQLWLLLETKLAISYEELNRAYREAERIKTRSLPSAMQAFDLAQKGYRAGKFEYLEVLDAQRTLFNERQKYIQALVIYHNKRADIDYLNSQTN